MSVVTADEMQVYRATAKRRATKRADALDNRFAAAWVCAERAGHLLKKHYDATQVLVFGSLLNRRLFHERSDIDLAAWGIAESDYLQALGLLLDLDPEFSFDLVRMEEARESIRQTVVREGREI